jgi:hypothetical protein
MQNRGPKESTSYKGLPFSSLPQFRKKGTIIYYYNHVPKLQTKDEGLIWQTETYTRYVWLSFDIVGYIYSCLMFQK